MKVRPIAGECGRYLVQSSSNPEQEHLVDLLEHFCGCGDYTCRRRVYEENTGKKYLCKHIREAREFFLNEILEQLRQETLSK